MTREEYDARVEKAVNRMFDTLEKCNPFNVTSTYVTCRNCGSKLNREYMSKGYNATGRAKCPICNSKVGLYSKTSNDKIDKANAYYEKVKKEENKIKDIKSKKDDTALSYKDAIANTEDRFDYILDEYTASDFTEIVGNIGGDVLTFRVYKDGSVYQK